jgi:hypothetical protein
MLKTHITVTQRFRTFLEKLEVPILTEPDMYKQFKKSRQIANPEPDESSTNEYILSP